VQTQGPRHKDGEGGVRRACHTVFIKKGSQLCFVTSSCEERLGQLSFFASARLGPPPARKYDHAARRRGVTATTATGALHRRTHTVRVPARCRRPGRMGGADDAGQRRAPNAICACVASTHPLASARPTRLHRPGRRYSLGPAPGGGRRWQWTSGRWWAAFRSIGAGGGVGPTTTTTTTAALPDPLALLSGAGRARPPGGAVPPPQQYARAHAGGVAAAPGGKREREGGGGGVRAPLPPQPPGAAPSLLIPPQLSGRRNVVTQDLAGWGVGKGGGRAAADGVGVDRRRRADVTKSQQAE
jgi:hypothetical protein